VDGRGGVRELALAADSSEDDALPAPFVEFVDGLADCVDGSVRVGRARSG
jgi:hypothetical protein